MATFAFAWPAGMSPDFDPQAFLRQLTSRPGVYRMLGAQDEVLYVGKARNLKKRVSSYFLRASGNPRIEQMVAQVARVEVTVTPSEDEALLLENSLIKALKPRYNVLLRDDKSYPYIRITRSHAYPRIMFHRGARTPADEFFGPYPSAATVRETLSLLQRVLQLRPCTDSYFANRTRPCLQHQIKRCSAPCVERISQTRYGEDVKAARDLLRGRGDRLLAEFGQRMAQQAAAQEYEAAAESRDRIAMLRRMQEQRVVTGAARDFDVVAVGQRDGMVGALVMSIRDGCNLGHRSLFPKAPAHTPNEEIMESFLGQYYMAHEPPREILINQSISDEAWLIKGLTVSGGRPVQIRARVRGQRRRLLEMAELTLAEALSARLVSHTGLGRRLEALQDALALDELPRRLECFDISHTQGESAVASCVVFDDSGSLRSAYRRFNIEGVEPGDDYAAIHQAVSRRYARIRGGEAPLPDVLFIDGGKGQVRVACDALSELDMSGQVRVVGVAKGSARKAGLEQLILPDQRQSLRLPDDNPALHLIQQIRDEAHRFAIAGHRSRRGKSRTRSVLEEIPGLGPKRRADLLREFGGLRQIERAGVEDLARVAGVSKALAQRVYDHIHDR